MSSQIFENMTEKKAQKNDIRGRNWVFTLNNYDDKDLMEFNTWVPEKCKYVAYAKEVGEQGTPHLQGFVSTAQPKQRLAYMKKLQDRAHWEVMRGSFEDNEKYCSKQGELVEIGELCQSVRAQQAAGRNSEKRRWEDAFATLKTGTTDGLPPDIYIRYQGTCDRLASKYAPMLKSLENPDHLWLWGSPGTGKTTAVEQLYGERLYRKTLNKWWDNFDHDQFDVAMIDEIDPVNGPCLLSFMKKWADKHPFIAEVKNSMMLIRPKRIIVCSNYHPKHIWKQEAEYAPICDRFRIVQVVGETRRRSIPEKNVDCKCQKEEIARKPEEEDTVPAYGGPLNPIQVDMVMNPTNN